MKTTMVLDTSVAIAWYLPEVFTEQARSWRRSMLDGRVAFTVPSLHYWEVANVLRTYVRRGELEAALAREIFDLHLDAPITINEPDRSGVLETALDLDATAMWDMPMNRSPVPAVTVPDARFTTGTSSRTLENALARIQDIIYAVII